MIKFKKLLSVLLAVMMVMSVMPTGLAFADDEVSLQASAGIPAGAISLYEEDFESRVLEPCRWVYEHGYKGIFLDEVR